MPFEELIGAERPTAVRVLCRLCSSVRILALAELRTRGADMIDLPVCPICGSEESVTALSGFGFAELEGTVSGRHMRTAARVLEALRRWENGRQGSVAARRTALR